MNGGTNARGEEVLANAYEGWYYGHASPWLKITGDVQGGDYNPFVGDNGNYEDRHDVMIVGNHHAREWMSYTVPTMQIEVIAFSYNNIGYDNDGDGRVDEDTGAIPTATVNSMTTVIVWRWPLNSKIRTGTAPLAAPAISV